MSSILSNRYIRILLALNLLVAGVWVGIYIYNSGAEDRYYQRVLAKVGEDAEARGGLTKAEYLRSVEISRAIKRAGTPTDADFADLLKMAARVRQENPAASDNAHLHVLGALMDAKSFTSQQRTKLDAFLSPIWLHSREHPIGALIGTKLAVKHNLPGGRDALKQLTQHTDPAIARTAKIMQERHPE